MKSKNKQTSNKIYTPEPPQVKYPLERPVKNNDPEKDKKLAQLQSIKQEFLLAHSGLFFILD